VPVITHGYIEGVFFSLFFSVWDEQGDCRAVGRPILRMATHRLQVRGTELIAIFVSWVLFFKLALIIAHGRHRPMRFD
jgi:hypothetical protein